MSALSAGPVLAASFDITGSDADGYFAIVGFNQEGNTTTGGISNDPNDPKFFDYPAYVNPNNTNNIYIMSVEPYKFGLVYPNPLHPVDATTYQDVSATLVEAFTEDADFADSDIGGFDFDAGLVTGVGVEVVGVNDLTLNLDGAEFESTNRTNLNPADVGPFGPDGRSNRNEFSNAVTLTPSNLSGTGLTFVDGVLTSIDLTADVSVFAAQDAFGGLGGFTGDGTLTFSNNTFTFDIDDFSSGFVSARLILNRTATIDAVGTYVIPEPASLALLGLTGLMVLRRRRPSRS